MADSKDLDPLSVLEAALVRSGGVLTVSDTATAAGVGIDEARSLLGRLMELYRASTSIDEKGGVRVVFRLPLRAHRLYSLGELWLWIRVRASRWIVWAARALVAVTVTVFMGWLLVLIQAIIDRLIRWTMTWIARREDPDHPHIAGPLFPSFLSGLAGMLSPELPRSAKEERALAVRENSLYPPRKPWLQGVVDYVIGEYRPAPHITGIEDVASFLRNNQGVLTATDIVLMSGSSFKQAERDLIRFAIALGGDITLAEDGTVIGDFRSFADDAATFLDREQIEWWKQYEPPYRHSGNHPMQKLAIAVFLAGSPWISAAGFQLIWLLRQPGKEALSFRPYRARARRSQKCRPASAALLESVAERSRSRGVKRYPGFGSRTL